MCFILANPYNPDRILSINCWLHSEARMKSVIYTVIDKLSTGRNILLFLSFFIIISIVINGKPFGLAQMKDITGGIGIIDMEFNYSVAKAYQILTDMGAQGRMFYTQIALLDIIFPLSYGLFLSTAICYFSRGVHFIPGAFIFIPIAGCLFDLTENLLISIMLHNFPKVLPTTATLANIMTMMKFSLITLSWTLLLIACVSFIIVKLRKRIKNIGR